MTTPTIEPGLKGTLSPEEYTTKTTPQRCRAVAPCFSGFGHLFSLPTGAPDVDLAAGYIAPGGNTPL